jgi:hypothetical protein
MNSAPSGKSFVVASHPFGLALSRDGEGSEGEGRIQDGDQKKK